MADSLYEALAGLQASPAETPYGIASQSLAATTPQLFTPYTSPGAAVGIGLGSVLLQSLLGYQAKQSALENTLQANSLANQMLKMQTPEERTSFLSGLDVSPTIGSKLSSLSLALSQQEQARKGAIADKLAELTAAGQFELGDLGTKLYERKVGQVIAEAMAKRTPKEPQDWFEKVPAAQKAAFTGTAGQVEQLRNLANTFRELGSNAVELNLAKQIPGSKADLAISAMQTLVPSTVKMLGDTGALSAYDQEAVKKATLGGRLSGSQSIADRLDQLANLAQSKTITSLEAYKTAAESGGAGLMEQLKKKQEPTQTSLISQSEESQKLKILQDLQAELAAEKAKRGMK